jgi:hypothetical protein
MTKTRVPTNPDDTLPRLIGGLIGLAFGVTLYALALTLRRVDALVVVGVAMSLGIARGSRRRSLTWSAGTAVAAAISSLLAMAWFRPFFEDDSLVFFVKHLGELEQRTWLVVAISSLAGAWFGYGRPRQSRSV